MQVCDRRCGFNPASLIRFAEGSGQSRQQPSPGGTCGARPQPSLEKLDDCQPNQKRAGQNLMREYNTTTPVIFTFFMAQFRVFAAPLEDVSQGWVRLGKAGLSHRSVVKLSVSNGSKHVYCELLSIDNNFIRSYNREGRIKIMDPSSALVAAEWYRRRLGGLQTRTDAEIEVTPANSIYGRIRACLDHPQVAIRIATVLGLWGFFLGLIGIILGIIPLFRES
jgi:hypothetical protein